MKKNGKTEKKRARVSQEDVPAYSLEEALRVASVLHDNFGKSSATPLRLASAMGVSPTSSGFRMLTGAAIAYGLTVGGYNAASIGMQPLATRILKPKVDGEDIIAKREAFLRPRIIGEFLRQYDNSPMPKTEIAKNVLADMGVPLERADSVLKIIISGAQSLGILHDIKGKAYVDLGGTAPRGSGDITTANDEKRTEEVESTEEKISADTPSTATNPERVKNRKVFITHGKNRAFVDPIKQLISFGEMEAIVAVERPSVSQPVPEKVMDDMRSCGAAIIHVEDELKLLDLDAKEHVMLNPNVLIEIGAAMALFKNRFVLLVKDGVRLPSNLQGLFEVRYKGDALDGDATIRLLGAINELKKRLEA